MKNVNATNLIPDNISLINVVPDIGKPVNGVPEQEFHPNQNREKGLPDQEARLDLAKTYLEEQALHWPELVKAGVLPKASADTLMRMADDLFSRFMSGTTSFVQKMPLDLMLACAYLRYSDLNSNPRTLDQQLRNVLKKARAENHFIPWSFIFADSGVTGTIATRRGYQLLKTLLKNSSANLQCVYIDELARLSRNIIESVLFGRAMEGLNKRIIGATDGFDSSTTLSKMQLTVSAMVHEMFIDQLRAKVLRGKADAFRLKKNIRPPALGYKLIPKLDLSGKPVKNSKEEEEKEKVIDESTAPEVKQAMHRFADDLWSPEKIYRDFNRRRVGGRNTHDRHSILQMFKRTTYVGIEYEGMTKKVFNPDTGKYKLIHVPKEEWQRREVPELAFVDDELFFRVQKRIAELKEAYRKKHKGEQRRGPSRTSLYPTLLIRPICSYCKKELVLGNSGKYQSLCCPNGFREKNDCQLKTYKSVQLINKTILNYLQQSIFTTEFVDEIARQANLFLEEEAKRPREDVQPIVQQYKEAKKVCKRLSRIIADPARHQFKELIKELKKKSKHAKKLARKIKELKGANAPLPEALKVDQVVELTKDLEGLLKDEVVRAAPLLRLILGDVEIEQVKDPRFKRTVWIAKFCVNLVPALLQIATKSNHPTTGCLEYLTQRSWKFTKSASISIREVPIYELIARDVISLKSQGLSDEVIARRLNTTPTNVRDARLFATLGVRPKTGPTRKQTGTGSIVKYKAIADEVVYLRDVKKMHFKEIAKLLKCGEATVRRAYDFKKPEVLQFEASRGVRPQRGRRIRLKPEVYEEIRRLINLGGLSDCEIARRCKCGANTVGRERKRMEAERRIA